MHNTFGNHWGQGTADFAARFGLCPFLEAEPMFLGELFWQEGEPLSGHLELMPGNERNKGERNRILIRSKLASVAQLFLYIVPCGSFFLCVFLPQDG
ncbi:hypothetical protein CEXT_726781 [Caerostris extrusa]|uniref:Uncharacterized protein n=1 Tax=Caerostris extrusa TaxID=172846 RepID=A0AAV4YAH6_CAEEX|nr:hypothetical protein CEXT_726781 [Caerostris extrusa]